MAAPKEMLECSETIGNTGFKAGLRVYPLTTSGEMRIGCGDVARKTYSGKDVAREGWIRWDKEVMTEYCP